MAYNGSLKSIGVTEYIWQRSPTELPCTHNLQGRHSLPVVHLLGWNYKLLVYNSTLHFISLRALCYLNWNKLPYLTLSDMKMLSDASAADEFWKNCGKCRNYYEQFITMSSTLSNIYTFLIRDFSYLWWYVFKVVCWRFVVCGKGLTTR